MFLWTPLAWGKGYLEILDIECPKVDHQEKWKVSHPLGHLDTTMVGSEHGPFYFSLSDHPSVAKYEQYVGDFRPAQRPKF